VLGWDTLFLLLASRTVSPCNRFLPVSEKILAPFVIQISVYPFSSVQLYSPRFSTQSFQYYSDLFFTPIFLSGLPTYFPNDTFRTRLLWHGFSPSLKDVLIYSFHLTLDEALKECTKNGGLAGLSGISTDMRDIIEAVKTGNDRALLARNKFIYDVKRYVGEFIVIMEGLDAIAFTGGIGQHDPGLREEVLKSLAFIGMKLDNEKNNDNKQLISAADSRIKALILETNEELVVARETKNVIEKYKFDCMSSKSSTHVV
jgi:hypothetical protein